MTTVDELTEFTLKTIGYFKTDDHLFPPKNQKYTYELSGDLQVTKDDVDMFICKLATDIGKEASKTLTSLTEKKLYYFSFTSISLLAFAGMSLPATALSVSMVVYTALGMITLYGATQFIFLFMQYDLDNLGVRNKVLAEIGSWSFERILTTFTPDTIARYDLFEAHFLGLGTETKCKFYASLANLYIDELDLQIARDADLLEVFRCYSEAVKLIKRWGNECYRKEKEIEHTDADPEVLEKTHRLVDLKIYGRVYELVHEWDIWKRNECERIRQAYDTAMMGLERAYQTLLHADPHHFYYTSVCNKIIIGDV